MAVEAAAAGGPSLLQSAFVFLAAAVVSVPVAKRLGLGSVLGYLIAGAVIGPFGLQFIQDPGGVLHAAEFGVVIMLFLIGLELQPAVLWRMRALVAGFGSLQVVLTGILGTALAMAFGVGWQMALAIGFTLSLSSTAIVLSSLRERGIAATDPGKSAFGVLLFQDIAIIPMLALFPLLATLPVEGGAGASALDALPAWARPVAVIGAVAAVVLGGRLLLRPVLRWIAATRLHEIFTAAALLLVVGVALLMQLVGLSPALGAFVAGVVLAESEFRHEIEGDIEPFRGLLLGLFFISVGASIDFALVAADPLLIAGLTLLLIAGKAAVLFPLARLFRHSTGEAALIALALAQGGEFAFVLFATTESAGVLPPDITRPLIVAVALSMALTPLLLMAGVWLNGRLLGAGSPARAPQIEEGQPEVIVAGYGRFGQVVGRMLAAQGYPVSVLDHDADQVELLRGFGRKVNYGDASRADLLRLAGAETARLLVVAIDDPAKAISIIETARREFPQLKVIARAYDRRAAYDQLKAGVDAVERETFLAAVRAGKKSMRLLGATDLEVEVAADAFISFDEKLMMEMYELFHKEDFATYQRIVRDRTALEQELLQREQVEAARRRAERVRAQALELDQTPDPIATALLDAGR
jgi:glutathione-regulated potassium-efflux system ancillary protein KefC